jgi:hypothetical protein
MIRVLYVMGALMVLVAFLVVLADWRDPCTGQLTNFMGCLEQKNQERLEFEEEMHLWGHYEMWIELCGQGEEEYCDALRDELGVEPP